MIWFWETSVSGEKDEGTKEMTENDLLVAIHAWESS